ncbi:10TM putative phosphate transporter cytosolic domain-containing protein [Chloropicon primus]|uniref:CSC1/OSCA1-like cytosolic domain-containing protein n=1 Tax=Chloropicon primus TaxID=1764295 RepID=A0A5B8MJD1_9CHLO|nr:hypothetical protein A3770_04p30550 [Chloropicon primus]UPQ99749.1 10TM putative phosphate transporter cytosolic domain-containing protein [Chloropicon primus]|eukprot:QDZ20537.1 hypothetical protein A3770_04p30550 [Chloropicon primus]
MAAAVAWLLYLVLGVCVWSVSKLFCKKIRKREKSEALSLNQAIQNADRLKLYKVKRDPNTHLPIFGTQSRFHFLDRPEIVGMESVGLGFYFYHLNMFLVILGVLSVTYFVNVTQYYNKVEFEESYTLQFADALRGSRNATCSRPYEVQNLITQLSAGSLCVKGGHSNPYFCPAVCTVTVREGQSVNDINMEDPLLCRKHMPCDHVESKELCCNIQLDAENNKFPFLSIWMMAFGIVLFSGWLACNKIMSDKLGERLNSAVITASDYTVLISGINPKRCTLEELNNFFRHYGSIHWAVPVPRIGNVIEKKKAITDLEEMQREISLHSKDTLDTMTVSGILFTLAYFGAPFFLRATFFGVEKALAARKDWITRRISALRKEIASAEAKVMEDARKNRNTGQALVTFSYEAFAKNAFNDQNRPIAKAFSKYTTCNTISRFPKFQDRTIKVSRAPEPSDFRWENTNTFGFNQGLRILCSNFGTVCVLLIGALIQLQLEVWKEDAISDFVAYKVGSAYKESDNKEMLLKQFRVRSLSMASSFAVVIVNMVMHLIAGAFSGFERRHSWSDTEKYLLMKLSTAYFLNTSVIPLLAATEKNWYVEGGFAEQVFYTQLIDAFMSPMLALLDPTWLCSRLSCQYAKTQDVLDKILVPPEFSLSIRYSDTIKTLSMAVIFAPMVPSSPLIGFLGILMQCATDRVIAFKMAQRPRQLQEGVMDMVFFLLKFISPLQLGLMYYCFSGIRNLLIIAAGIWFLAAAYSVFRGAQRTKELEDAGTGGLSFKDASDSCDLSTDDVEDKAKTFEEFFFSAETEESLGEKINALFPHEGDEFHECEEKGEAGSSSGTEESRMEKIKSTIKQKYFTYTPFTSSGLGRGLKEEVQQMFDLSSDVCPPNKELMTYQKAETGGRNTDNPMRTVRTSRKSSVFKSIKALESNLKTHRRSRAGSRRNTMMSIFQQVNSKRKSLLKMETPNPLFNRDRQTTTVNQLNDDQL